VFTRSRHWSLSWAKWIQSTFFHPISQRSIFILFSHLCLGLPSGLFPSGFPTKILYAFLICSMCATCPIPFILLDLITLITVDEAYKLWSSSLCSLLQSPTTYIAHIPSSFATNPLQYMHFESVVSSPVFCVDLRIGCAHLLIFTNGAFLCFCYLYILKVRTLAAFWLFIQPFYKWIFVYFFVSTIGGSTYWKNITAIPEPKCYVFMVHIRMLVKYIT